ncbi:hypothetical protein EXIGLDRAFT_199363 [Exidia glandulosa HHB12029]|uniref:T6SS Phospholipase effector Tle1-like catalytic domain-containing protein n=1 Tax=Exidia glandulosa HHB12029 TaxID=1314781 RepID=A0A165MY98_EXIGL|nr:hypothetical protein EXIGLDRAFT_199363 [Exidia glandulosa HHB12029]
MNPAEATVSMKARFKETFSRAVRVHFVGAWDTVSSVGVLRGKTLPGTTDGMQHVCYFRHALALHERRVKFLPEYANGASGPPREDSDQPHTKEVWFAGSHSDIGGGSTQNAALNRFGPSLRWMTFEASRCGLLLTDTLRQWEDSNISESLSGAWNLLEYLPFSRVSFKQPQENGTVWWPHLGEPRAIKPGQMIHESAIDCQVENRATVPVGTFWEELVHRDNIEHDPYAAAQHIARAMLRKGKSGPLMLTTKELHDITVLTKTDIGLKSLRDVQSDLISGSFVEPLLTSLETELAQNSVQTSSDGIGTAQVIVKALSAVWDAPPPAQVKKVARSLAFKDAEPANDFMKAFSSPALGSNFGSHDAAVTCVAFLPDDRRLVSASNDGTLRIWNVATGELDIGPVPRHDGRVTCISVHGWRIASSGYDGTFSVSNFDSGALLVGPVTAHKGKTLHSIAFSPAGIYLATGGGDDLATIWNAYTGAKIHDMVGHIGP